MMLSSVHPNKKEIIPDDRYDKEKNNLHQTIKFLLIIGQAFGLMPVMGITKLDERSLYYTWKSWKVLYCLCSCTGLCIITGLITYNILSAGAHLLIMGTFVHYVSNLVVTLLFLQLARHWPTLMREWHIVEISMRRYGWPSKLKLRMQLITTIIITIGAVLYIMDVLTSLEISYKCNRTDQPIWEYYCVNISFPFIFSVLKYHFLLGIIVQVLGLMAYFTQLFNDIFIMVISSALAVRFRQVTSRLQALASKKITTVSIWKDIREDYNNLCKLCRTLDDLISYLVLMSFASNLFFILLHLFNSLRTMRSSTERIYFFMTFGFLILRTVYVSLYGAWINDESKMPVAILNSVSSSVYNAEIRRFIQQISFNSVGLTGRNFFHVTRGLILSIAGAIVTYELVLIQFNENLLKKNKSNTTRFGC